MSLKTLRSNAGLTYIGALVMVVLLGIMASRAAVAWKMRIQREKETELIFRGMQYMEALRRWYWPKGVPGYVPIVVAGGISTITTGTPGASDATGATGATGTTTGTGGATTALPANIPGDALQLKELKDLLTGPGAAKTPFLRKLYLDPITGKEFDVIRDANQKIIGVKSSSEKEPIKKANFPFELNKDDFENKAKYSDWQFICTRWPTPPGTGGKVKGLPTSGAGGDQGSTGSSSGDTGLPGQPPPASTSPSGNPQMPAVP